MLWVTNTRVVYTSLVSVSMCFVICVVLVHNSCSVFQFLVFLLLKYVSQWPTGVLHKNHDHKS